MKHPIMRRLQGALCACLCFVILFGALVPAVAETTDPLDFGISGRENNTTLSAEELYVLLFDRTPTPAESEFLSGMGLTMTYNGVIPDDRIATVYNGESGTLELSARVYTYTATGGETVTWIPTHATIGDTTCPLVQEGDTYTCTFRGLLHSDDFDLSVDYTWTASVPMETVNLLQNAAWRAGNEALQTEADYQTAMAEYNALLDAHKAWVAYLDWVEDRADYLKEKGIYDGKLEAYNTYKAEYDAYAAVKDAYDQWVAYYASVDFYTNHLQEWKAYEDMKGKMDPIMERMAIMETIYTTESHGWQMYASIMGGTVSSVLDRKHELVDYLLISEEDVDLAGVATANLRILLSEYNALRKASYESEHAKNLALFQYYQANYIALRDNFKDLYRTLNSFYIPLLIKVLDLEGKLAHYQQFVAQLYVISTFLDDEGGRNTGWTISNKSLTTLVEAPLLLADRDNADLRGVSFPAYAPKVEWQPVLSEPTVAKPDQEPTAPTPVVEHPGDPPAFVAEPTEEDKPPEAAHPGDAPAAPVYDDVTKALMAEIRAETLTERPSVTENVPLTFARSVTRTVSIRNLKNVTFYDHTGNLLHRTTVDYDSYVSYPVPERAEDEAYRYRPLGWVLADGTEPDLTHVTGDLSLYPLYDVVAKTYTVTWILDGVSYSGAWLYGTTPTPPMSLNREEGQYYRYEFSGWDKEVTAVTGDVTYTGTFLTIPKEYTVTWVTQNGTVTETERLPFGSIPSYPGDLSMETDQNRYEFLGWDKPFSPLSGDITYTAQYRVIPLAVEGEGKSAEVIFSDTELVISATESSVDIREAAKLALETGRTLTLSWSKGISLHLDASALSAFSDSGCRRIVLSSQAIFGGESFRVSFLSGSGRSLTPDAWGVILALSEQDARRFTLESGEAVPEEGILLTSGLSILAKTVHAVTSDPNPLCNLYALTRNAVAGDLISLRLTCSFGYGIKAAQVIAEDGTVIQVAEDLTFVMPDAPVHVSLTVEKLVYRVTFLVEGAVWSYAEYGLGDRILLPEAPTKGEDDTYLYTFSEWTNLLTVAAGEEYDIVCEAIFSRSLKNIDYDTGHNNNLLMERVLPLVAVGVVLLTALIIFLCVRRRRKRARLQKDALGVEETAAEPTPEVAEPAETPEVETAMEESNVTPEDATPTDPTEE